MIINQTFKTYGAILSERESKDPSGYFCYRIEDVLFENNELKVICKQTLYESNNNLRSIINLWMSPSKTLECQPSSFYRSFYESYKNWSICCNSSYRSKAFDISRSFEDLSERSSFDSFMVLKKMFENLSDVFLFSSSFSYPYVIDNKNLNLRLKDD